MRRGSVLMGDGYEEVAQTHQLVHLGCWAHCRRYFVEALEALPAAQTADDYEALLPWNIALPAD